jgi:ribosomal protein L14E/L6E/L27E
MNAVIKEGTVCTVMAGRRTGEEVTVTKVVDKNCIMAKTKKGKDRKFSILHITPVEKN